MEMGLDIGYSEIVNGEWVFYIKLKKGHESTNAFLYSFALFDSLAAVSDNIPYSNF
jgi:hypothetical protein